jgi:kinesin family protein 3/17
MLKSAVDMVIKKNKKDSECVKVVIRCRPLFGKEIAENRKELVVVDEKNCKITVPNPEEPNKAPKAWTFDAVYGKVRAMLPICLRANLTFECLTGHGPERLL